MYDVGGWQGLRIGAQVARQVTGAREAAECVLVKEGLALRVKVARISQQPQQPRCQLLLMLIQAVVPLPIPSNHNAAAQTCHVHQQHWQIGCGGICVGLRLQWQLLLGGFQCKSVQCSSHVIVAVMQRRVRNIGCRHLQTAK